MDNFYLISHGTLSEIADSIREKKGISDGLQVSDFAEQISSIEGGSIESVDEFCRQYLTDELYSQLILDRGGLEALSIKEGAFYGDQTVAFVDLPKAQYIGAKAFCGCTNLQEIHLPNCLILDGESFGLDYSYTPNGNYQHFWRDQYPEVNMPKIEEIYSHALDHTAIDVADLQNAVILGSIDDIIPISQDKVLSCESLESISSGWIQELKIEDAILPACYEYYEQDEFTYYRYSAFSDSSLRSLTFRPSDMIPGAFSNCTKLKELNLLSDQVVHVDEYDDHYGEVTPQAVFKETPILNHNGVIRVPDELVGEYQEHWFWSQLPIVSSSGAGVVKQTTSANIFGEQEKEYTIGYLYGWDFESLYIDYMVDSGDIQIEDCYVDLETNLLYIRLIAPALQDDEYACVWIYLEDDLGHNYETYLDVNMKVPGTVLSIDPITVGAYGFDYYGPGIYTLQSTNSKLDNTTAETKVDIFAPHDGTLVLDWYIESEGCCDKGSISSIDSTTYPTNQVYAGNSSSTPRTGTLLLPISMGEHFIYLKYRKDGSVNHGIDAFRVTFSFEE